MSFNTNIFAWWLSYELRYLWYITFYKSEAYRKLWYSLKIILFMDQNRYIIVNKKISNMMIIIMLEYIFFVGRAWIVTLCLLLICQQNCIHIYIAYIYPWKCSPFLCKRKVLLWTDMLCSYLMFTLCCYFCKTL